jgi:CRP-like cAMP-binding protein
VFSEGLHVDRVFLLLDGHIRVLRTTSQGDQIILLHIAPGQVFGIGAALGHKGYPAPEMAAEDCVVLAWPNRLWPKFVARYDEFASQS